MPLSCGEPGAEGGIDPSASGSYITYGGSDSSIGEGRLSTSRCVPWSGGVGGAALVLLTVLVLLTALVPPAELALAPLAGWATGRTDAPTSTS
jgi:hypothetical protein